jgi:hypothetical protein
MAALRDDLELALDRAAFAQQIGIEPDDWQRDLLRSSADRVLLNCCRHSGKSTVSAILALHRSLYHPGSLVLCLAPSLRQSQELFVKVAGFYRDLGRPVPAHAERKLSFELENESRIVTLPGTEKTVRGFSGAALLVVDEASRVSDELYFGIRPMLAVSGGALIMLSTPAGKRGVFHQEWTEGVGWQRFEIPWSVVPRITPSFIEEERRSLPARIFRQEYECSFEDVEDAVFAYELVEQAITPDIKPLFGSTPREGACADEEVIAALFGGGMRG